MPTTILAKDTELHSKGTMCCPAAFMWPITGVTLATRRGAYCKRTYNYSGGALRPAKGSPLPSRMTTIPLMGVGPHGF